MIDKSPDIRSAVWALRETELGWTPGSRFAYSDAGYQILALILEAVYGRPFPTVIQQNIFEPLGMTGSVAALTHSIRPRLATGYRCLYDDRPPHVSQPLVPAAWIEVSLGDCSIASTAADMARFGQMLLNRGAGANGRILAPASYAAMTQLHSAGGWFDYGYGIMLRRVDNFVHIGHGGGMPGYIAELIIDVDTGIGLALLSSRPSAGGLFWRLMRLWRMIHLRQPLAAADLSIPDPRAIKNAAEYAGVYRGDDRSLTLVAAGGQLQLKHDGQTIALESRDDDRLYAAHPDFDRFLLHFGRTPSPNAEAGAMVEAMYGPDWYVKDSYTGPRAFDIPAVWRQYPGHYRSHNPWQTNFRVILRKGTLVLAEADGDETPLFAIGEHEFGIGEQTTPERIVFSQLVDGQALCATRSGCEYYRFFTP